MSIKVDTVTVETTRGKVEFTLEELKELQEMLNNLFGKEKEIVIRRDYQPYWLGTVKYGDFNSPNQYVVRDSTDARKVAEFKTSNLSCSFAGREV